MWYCDERTIQITFTSTDLFIFLSKNGSLDRLCNFMAVLKTNCTRGFDSHKRHRSYMPAVSGPWVSRLRQRYRLKPRPWCALMIRSTLSFLKLPNRASVGLDSVVFISTLDVGMFLLISLHISFLLMYTDVMK